MQCRSHLCKSAEEHREARSPEPSTVQLCLLLASWAWKPAPYFSLSQAVSSRTFCLGASSQSAWGSSLRVAQLPGTPGSPQLLLLRTYLWQPSYLFYYPESFRQPTRNVESTIPLSSWNCKRLWRNAATLIVLGQVRFVQWWYIYQLVYTYLCIFNEWSHTWFCFFNIFK